MQSMQSSLVVLPQWLVRALTVPTLRDEGGFYPSFSQGSLLPFFHPHQLYGLSHIIDTLQGQLLAQEPSDVLTLRLNPSTAFSDLVPARSSLQTELGQTLIQLGSLRLLYSPTEHQWLSRNVFKDEKWVNDGDSNLLYLYGDELSSELLLGLINGADELMRLGNQAARVKPLLAGSAPVALLRSLWLGSSAQELSLMLQIYHYLGEQGEAQENHPIVALPFNAINFRETASAQSFQIKMRLLQQVVGKMQGYGYLQPLTLADLSSAPALTPALQLLIKPGAEDLYAPFSQIAEQRLQAVSSYFVQTSLHKAAADISWFSPFTTGLTSETARKLTVKLLEVLKRSSNDLAHFKDSIVIDGNVVVPLTMLFVEWSLRSQMGHSFPLLPDALQIAEAGLLAQVRDGEGEITRKLTSFLPRFVNDTHLAQWIEKQPFASLMSEQSQKNKRFNLLAKPAEQKYSNEVVAPSPKKLEKPEEVEKLKATSQEKYHNLVVNYFNSLEPVSQQIILKMKKSLPPHLFEDHLMKRLARFAADNPDYL